MNAVHALTQMNLLPLTYHHDSPLYNVTSPDDLTDDDRLIYNEIMEQERII